MNQVRKKESSTETYAFGGCAIKTLSNYGIVRAQKQAGGRGEEKRGAGVSTILGGYGTMQKTKVTHDAVVRVEFGARDRATTGGTLCACNHEVRENQTSL